jgi:transcription elongation factor GreA
LILLAALEQSGDRRELVKKMQGILTSGRYAIVRKIMKTATLEDVKEFLLLVTKCHSLSEHDIQIFHSLAEVAYPSLATGSKEAVEEDVIWTTREGYESLQKRIEHIGTVETVENAKEIETARAHGDLRENAEFKAALERRDRLQTELKLLSDQLNHARILSKEEVDISEVSVGTTVDCKGSDGKVVSYTLLGPWDADPDKNILSFQSKLAKEMMGRKVGDSFKIQNQTYTIEAIRLAL